MCITESLRHSPENITTLSVNWLYPSTKLKAKKKEREKILSGLSFLSPGDLPDPGIEPATPALAGGFFTTEPPGKSSSQYTSMSKRCKIKTQV